MELHPGQVLSHFRVIEKFDEGGMGVVYRAHDLHLERDVALKVLSRERSASSSAENRFRREALALSRLNHPNIAAVFDFDVHEGIRFLVMEWIAGATLPVKLAAGPLPEREILDFADQMASALAYAHAEGVIHRDLKPSNLRIAADGRIKILDFGLARLTPISGSTATITRPDAGIVPGTLPYIAPEILSGHSPSWASDVYGLAAVLYELATARRAFPQKDPATLTAAILSDPPAAPRLLNPAISPELEHVILRGLEKTPALRYATATEVRADLRRIASGLPLIPIRRRFSMPRYLPWLGLTAIGAALLIAPGVVGRRDPPASPVMEPIVTWPSAERSARISPDRQWIAFLSDSGGTPSIYLQRVKGGEPRLLLSQPGVVDALWSPDGENIGVLRTDLGSVSFQIVPAFGGRAPISLHLPRELSNAALMRWYGRNVYLRLSRSGIWRLDTASGRHVRIFEAAGEEGARESFDIHGDERRVIYSVRSPSQITLWLGDLAGGKRERLTTGADNESGGLFAGDHWLIFTSDRSNQIDLWRLDLRSGEREQITFSRGVEFTQSVTDDLSLLTYVEQQNDAHLWMYSRATGHRQLTAEMLRDEWPSISRDGRLALQRQKPLLNAASVILNGEVLLSSLLPSGVPGPWSRIADGGMPVLSPDGSRVAYARPASRAHEYELHVIDLATLGDRIISSGFRLPKYYPWPRDFERRSIAWADDGAALFIMRSVSGLDEIRRWSGTLPAETLYTAPKGMIVRELYADGDRITFVSESSPAPGPVEVHLLADGGDRILASMNRDFRQTIYLRGPLPDRRWVVLRAALHPDYTERASIAVIDPQGRAGEVGTIDRAYAGTAKLDSRSGTLYFTAADDRGVHNLYAFSLHGGTTERLTTNSVPGISFGGFEVTAAGDLLYVVQKSSQDVWLIDFHPHQRKESRP